MREELELEVFHNHFAAIVEDMARVMERTAYTTFVRETADFSVGIVATTGEFVAYPWNLGASSYLGMNVSSTLELIADPAPGDVYICNDPYLAGPLCTHLPDLHVFRPVFAGGELLCWAYAFIHASDVGGTVPASVWIHAREIHQEGLRLGVTKLVAEGRVDQTVVDLILQNTRIPEANWGDIRAMLSVLDYGERSIRGAVARFGRDEVRRGMHLVLDHAEARARQVLARIPGGRYTFADYLEDDLNSSMPLRIVVAVEPAEDGGLIVDYTGTDPQVESALNIASGGEAHPFLLQAVLTYIVSLDREIPKASSILRPVRVVAPEGTVVNAEYPAAVGLRYALSLRLADATIGALSAADPSAVPGGSSGVIAPIAVSSFDGASGRNVIHVAQPLIGGSAGRSGLDGLDGVDCATAGYLRNTPVESIESEMPILLSRYGLQPDSGGAGRWRGGLAVQLEIEGLRPGTAVVARALERFRLQPWGVQGGGAGTSGWCRRIRRDGSAEELGKVDVVRLEPGERVAFCSPAGGGYGSPFDRLAEEVLADVLDGKLSEARALEAYGVVVAGGAVDAGATAEARAGRHRDGTAMDLGTGRAELEARWPAEVQDWLGVRVAALPTHLRYWAKSAFYEAYLSRGPGAGGEPERPLAELWADVTSAIDVEARP